MNKTAPIKCLYTEIWSIDKFTENPRNPNKHPQSQIALLGRLIIERGWRSPIVVSSLSGLVVKGHGRLKAARHAGLTTCPVEIQDYVTEAQETADMIADNRIAELATRSDENMSDLLSELNTDGLGTIDAGFTEADFVDLVGSISESAEAASRAVSDTVFQYNVIFSNGEQQAQWFALLKRLKSENPGAKSIAEGLLAFMEQKAKSA
jgi:hypothetical protein